MATTIRTTGFGRDADEIREQRELDRLADADAAENWDDPTWRKAWFKDLAETIWLGFEHENLVQMISTVENAGEFERITVEIVEGLEVFWVSAGSAIDATALTSAVWEMEKLYVGYHLTEWEDNIRSGFSKFQSQLVSRAVSRMDAAINSRLLRTLSAALEAGSDLVLSGAGLDLDDLNTALEEVEDTASGWPEDVGQIAIIGRPTMITALANAIKDDNGFVPETNEQIIRLGLSGTYRNARLIKLRNWKDRNRVSYFPGNELLITSTAATKTGIWEGMKTREWTEEGGEYWHTWGKRSVGFAVPHPEFARKLVDTNRDA